MSRWFQRLIGDTETFALSLAFDRDPHPGAGLDPAVMLSYGELAIWVRGACVTSTLRQGDGVSEGLSGHLLPLLEWLCERAVPLLNEEAWAVDAGGAASAASWMDASERPGLALTTAEEDAWFERRWAWWDRHALRAGLRGWAAPNLFLRRLGDDVELSWDHRRWGSVRPDRLFVHPEGAERIPAELVSGVLQRTLDAAADALASADVDVTALRAKVAALAAADAHPWLIPETTRSLLAASGWESRVWPQRPPGLLARHTPATRLLRSARLATPGDVQSLLDLLDAPLSPWPVALDAARAPSTPSLMRPWAEGYTRAGEVREALSLGDARLDMDALTRALALSVTSLPLAGHLAGGVIVSHDRASIVSNPALSTGARLWGHGMLLATALGHLTMDPWARDYAFLHGADSDGLCAARAKAFGAMFLMPEDGVRRVLSARGTTDRLQVKDVQEVSSRFGASYTSTAQHLKNLGLVSASERDDLLAAAA